MLIKPEVFVKKLKCKICGAFDHIGIYKCPVAKKRLSKVRLPPYTWDNDIDINGIDK